MTESMWEKVTIILLSTLIGGAPGYFLVGPSKTTREDVVSIVQTRVPTIIEEVVKDLRVNTSQIDKRLSVMEERLTYISKSIDRLKK